MNLDTHYSTSGKANVENEYNVYCNVATLCYACVRLFVCLPIIMFRFVRGGGEKKDVCEPANSRNDAMRVECILHTQARFTEPCCEVGISFPSITRATVRPPPSVAHFFLTVSTVKLRSIWWIQFSNSK